MYIDDRVLSKLTGVCDYCYLVYEQEKSEVILGRSRPPKQDVYIQRCRTNNIPVMRRLGGGGTVLLTPGVIVISVSGRTALPFHLREHMYAVNTAIIRALSALEIKGLGIKGISDIAIGDKKILGSSLYKKKDTVLYQGSLLLNPDLKLFDRYLKHPEKEPDYRQGRLHRDFLTSLWNEGYGFDAQTIISVLNKELEKGAPWRTLNPG
jgi:lipoate-protein ligase A